MLDIPKNLQKDLGKQLQVPLTKLEVHRTENQELFRVMIASAIDRMGIQYKYNKVYAAPIPQEEIEYVNRQKILNGTATKGKLIVKPDPKSTFIIRNPIRKLYNVIVLDNRKYYVRFYK